EMYESALRASAENYDFIFVHFHGIDDRGHSYGPEADETMLYIKLIDSYISELSNIWDGTIILTADHGMHETENGGTHGECRYSDMVVPYFLKN
ncbi:MAG: alkaline phosphatase family protein, partial [Sedimentibacter sp.]